MLDPTYKTTDSVNPAEFSFCDKLILMKHISFLKVADENTVRLVETLANEIWAEHYTPIIGQSQVEYMLKNFQSAKAINKQIDEGHLYYLIKDEEGYKGYIGIVFKDKYLFLSKIYIRSICRGMGYGKQAVGFIEEIARENGLKKIVLTVNKYNKNSIEAYKKLEFTIRESIIQDIGEGYIMDDYKMEKIL